jgi:hypothetical protein
MNAEEQQREDQRSAIARAFENGASRAGSEAAKAYKRIYEDALEQAMNNYRQALENAGLFNEDDKEEFDAFIKSGGEDEECTQRTREFVDRFREAFREELSW